MPRIKVKWSLDATKDLKHMHSIDVALANNNIAKDMARIIDEEIIQGLMHRAEQAEYYEGMANVVKKIIEIANVTDDVTIVADYTRVEFDARFILQNEHCPSGCGNRGIEIVCNGETIKTPDISCDLMDPKSFDKIAKVIKKWVDFVKSDMHINTHAYLYD